MLILCSGASPESTSGRLIERFDLTDEMATAAIDSAQARIVQAAAFDREREFGRAYYRLTDIYLRAIREEDGKTALAAQKEMNRLLGLALPAKQAAHEKPATAEIGPIETAVRGYLVPLGLARPEAPLVEHVRLAAGRIIDLAESA